MTLRKKITVGSVLAGVCCAAAQADTPVDTAFQQGTVNGNIRARYHTREYPANTDEAAFALGGALRAETGDFGWGKVGVGFYTAQDLGTNSSDPAEVNGRLGSELEVLGEANFTTSALDTQFTLGRQKINTPFANPGDAFIVPFTFEGYSIVNNTFDNLKLQLDYINTIKNRNSDEFVDVGVWNTNRLGIESQSTSGTLIMGATYKTGPISLDGWYYNFDHMFNTFFVQGGYTFATTGDIRPFVGAQFGNQSEVGDELLGTVDSTLFGIQGGAAFGKGKLVLAVNQVAEQEDAFKNGAFLAPYNFSTSPIFTNNMLETVENVDAGSASKLTFFYSFPKVELKLSHALFDFNNVVDRDATDIDIIYDMSEYTTGLSARWRVEIVSSDTEAVEQTNHRFQLEYTF